MLVYVYGKCSTCKDAIRFLEKHHATFTLKEITEETPSINELKKMLAFQDDNLKSLFNTSGNLYKEMNLKEKFPSLSVSEALKLLHQNGMLIKRPFILAKDFGLLGFKPDTYKRYFS